MGPSGSASDLIASAVAGDRTALERLLLADYQRLMAYVERRFPARLRGALAPEDVLQETLVDAFQHIGSFTPAGPDAFYRWLTTIATHRLADAAKAQRTLKRGAGRAWGECELNLDDRSVVALLDQLAADDLTASRVAARGEAVKAIHVALAGLNTDYREALRLRYIEGLPLATVAARMGRTERAVDNLCDRGRKQLRQSMGRASQYLTRK